MTKQEAVELLQIHSGKHPQQKNFKLQNGLVGMLKHFSGQLDENPFLDVLRAIQCLSAEFQQENIKTEILSYVMEIYCFIKYDVLKTEKFAMHLSTAQKDMLKDWNHTIFSGITDLVHGMPFSQAFPKYAQMLSTKKKESVSKNHRKKI